MKKIIYLLIGCVMITTGCDQKLELTNPNFLTSTDYWKTKEQVQAAVMGCYASLTGSATGSRSAAESFFLWGELRADMITSTLGTTNEQIDVINVNILPTNSIAN